MQPILVSLHTICAAHTTAYNWCGSRQKTGTVYANPMNRSKSTAAMLTLLPLLEQAHLQDVMAGGEVAHLDTLTAPEIAQANSRMHLPQTGPLC